MMGPRIYPMTGRMFSDAHGRALVVDSVDERSIVLRVAGRSGTRPRVMVVSLRTWNNMHMREIKRAS